MVINARSLAKPDACSALYLELNSHNVDLGIVTETWLKSTIPSQVVCPDGFTVIRKDRPYGRQGGGAASFVGTIGNSKFWKNFRILMNVYGLK